MYLYGIDRPLEMLPFDFDARDGCFGDGLFGLTRRGI